MTIIIAVIAVLAVAHLAGGARTHRRHYRQHGMHPNLYYTYAVIWPGHLGGPDRYADSPCAPARAGSPLFPALAGSPPRCPSRHGARSRSDLTPPDCATGCANPQGAGGSTG
jgi:hypothetical protein